MYTTTNSEGESVVNEIYEILSKNKVYPPKKLREELLDIIENTQNNATRKCKDGCDSRKSIVCMDHINQCAHEYAAVIKKYSDIGLHDLSDTWIPDENWHELVSNTGNSKDITRFDGVYRSWSMPDGYCGLIA